MGTISARVQPPKPYFSRVFLVVEQKWRPVRAPTFHYPGKHGSLSSWTQIDKQIVEKLNGPIHAGVANDQVPVVVIQEGVYIEEEFPVETVLAAAAIGEIGDPLLQGTLGAPFGHDGVEGLHVIVVDRTAGNQEAPTSRLELLTMDSISFPSPP